MSVAPKPEPHRATVAPIFPIATAAAWIIEAFVSGGDPLPHLWRPLLIATISAAGITLVAWLAGRRRATPVLLAGVFVLLFLKAWPLLGAALAVAIWRAALAFLRRRAGRPPLPALVAEQVVRLANTFSLILLIVVLGALALSGAVAFPEQTAARGAATPSAPNIYFVLLDGYPRQDSLEALGIDNRPFLEQLGQRDFSVASGSRTNYHNTLLTLVSMLNGQYLADLPELATRPGDRPGEERTLHRALNSARLLDNLREHGFQIIDSPAAYGAATLLNADVVMAHGTINQFDQRILSRTFLGDLLSILSPGLVDGWLREAVLAPIRDVEAVAADPSDGPHFMLAHVLSPHPPFLFDADGAAPRVHACYASGCSMWTTERAVLGMSAAAYTGLLADQIEFLNGEILQMVDRVVADDPTAVIVLFGDHGIRFDAGVSLEYYRNFFAARTPGREDLFPDDVSPVNVLSTLENAYLGTSLPINHYQAWESKGGLLLNLDRWLPDPT
jgi:hypothetical protein